MFLSSLAAFVCLCASSPTIEFVGGDVATAESPVTVQIPSTWLEKHAFYVDASSNRRPLQLLRRLSNESAEAVCIAPALAAGAKQRFSIGFVSSPEAATVIREDSKDGISISIEGKPFTTLTSKGYRKPILWPIRFDGEEMTQNGPSDHIHHRSFWFTHGKVNGHDFWSEKPNAGRTSIARVEPFADGSVFTQVTCTVDWLSKAGEKVLEDTRTYRIVKLGETRLIDFEIEFDAKDREIVFGDDKEGTFGVRVPASMQVDQKSGKSGGTLINAEGLKNNAVWGKKSAWCDYFGPVNGKTLGIAILDNPKNLRHPTTWHARTYGLFCANPFGLSFFTNKKETGEHRVPKGSKFKLAYRVIFHAGNSAEAKIAEQFAAYANPPRVTISE